MLRRKFGRPNHATVVAYLALFVALGGTGAYAANTIRSTDIVDGEVTSADVANQNLTGGDIKDNTISSFDVGSLIGDDVVDGTLTGVDIKNFSLTTTQMAANTLTSADLATGSVGTDEVQNNSLGGVDINESSLVGLEDVCPPTTTVFLPVCAGTDGGNRTWVDAVVYCRQFGLRLPSLGEASALAALYDVPGVADGEAFWTDEHTGTGTVFDTAETGGFGQISATSTRRTVCVTTPSSLYQ